MSLDSKMSTGWNSIEFGTKETTLAKVESRVLTQKGVGAA